MATLADRIPNEDCYTIEDLAAEMGLSTLRSRQVIEKAVKEKYVQNLTKKEGRRILYTPQMVDQLLKAKEKGFLGKFHKKKDPESNLKKAVYIIKVGLFDPEIVSLITKKYKDEVGIQKHVKEMLESEVKPLLSKKRLLEEEYKAKLSQLMSEEETESVSL